MNMTTFTLLRKRNFYKENLNFTNRIVSRIQLGTKSRKYESIEDKIDDKRKWNPSTDLTNLFIFSNIDEQYGMITKHWNKAWSIISSLMIQISYRFFFIWIFLFLCVCLFDKWDCLHWKCICVCINSCSCNTAIGKFIW